MKITTPFPVIEVKGGQRVELKVNFLNEGEEDEVLDLSVAGPEGWRTTLKSGGFVVKSLYLGKKEGHTLDFEAVPTPGQRAGNYTFVIRALSRDRTVEATLSLRLEGAGATAPPGIALSTAYPSVESPSGQESEFTVSVASRGGERRLIDFSAIQPKGWRISFKPQFEESLVRSLEFEADETRVLIVTVQPPPEAQPGRYDVTIVAESGGLRERLSLVLNILGTYALELSTPTGLVSLETEQGREALLNLVVENAGTAPLESITLSSSEPVGWDVDFRPREIASIAAGSSREATVTIKPPSDAIPGDYLVLLRTTAEKSLTSGSLNLRVTVQGSLGVGLVGVGIIAAVAAAVFAVFWRLGRR